MAANVCDYFSKKKTTVTFVLSLFVFFIHFCAFSAFSDTGVLLQSTFDWLLAMTHVAVPLFFVISAVMFYRNYTLASTLRKWKNRVFSLCVPYCFWNTVWLLLAFIGYYTPLGAFTGGVKAAFSLEAVLRGILLHEYFLPFWFMLQLIVLTALCPIIYLLLKNKWIGIVTIVAVYVFYCLSVRLNAAVSDYIGMSVFYLLGAWVGIHHYSLFESRKSKKNAAFGALAYVLCCVYFGINSVFPQWFPTEQINLIVKVVSCAGFWVFFDCFEMRHCPKFMQESFLIYAMHSLVGAVLTKVFYMILPPAPFRLALVAVLAFPLTIVIICTSAMFMGKYMPRVKRILAGK